MVHACWRHRGSRTPSRPTRASRPRPPSPSWPSSSPPSSSPLKPPQQQQQQEKEQGAEKEPETFVLPFPDPVQVGQITLERHMAYDGKDPTKQTLIAIRGHVHGLPGGSDAALFRGAPSSPAFSAVLWRCAGYVPKRYARRITPSWAPLLPHRAPAPPRSSRGTFASAPASGSSRSCSPVAPPLTSPRSACVRGAWFCLLPLFITIQSRKSLKPQRSPSV